MPRPETSQRQECVRSALEKQSAGQRLTRRETAALKRFLREKEDRERKEYYRTVPQKHYELMSGRQRKTLKEQAALYCLPCGGKMIDMFQLLRAAHDLIAQRGHRVLKSDDQGVLNGPSTKSLERLRLAKAIREEFAYKRELGHYQSVDEVQQRLTMFSNIIRQGITDLHRGFGERPRAIMVAALDEAGKTFDRIARGEACPDLRKQN